MNPLGTAIIYNNFDLFRYIVQNDMYELTEELCNHVVANGNLKMLKYIHCVYGEIMFSQRTFSLAASHGHLNIVKYLYHHTTCVDITGGINAAIYNNHDEIGFWLLKNRYVESDEMELEISKRALQIEFNKKFNVHMFEDDPNHHVKTKSIEK